MHSFMKQTTLQLMVLLSLGEVIRSENYPYLPPPPHYTDGGFTGPNTTTTQVFSNGSQMNVSWYTDYPSVNLYLIYGTDYAAPFTCTSGTTQTWWIWTVDDHGNNTAPFSFRAVNAQGTAQEQEGGGFYTGQFWVSVEPGETTTSTVTTSSTHTSTSTHATTDSTTTSLSTSTPAPTSAGTTTLASTSSSASTSLPASTSNSSPSGSSNVEIGVGVGVGVGVAALIIGACFFWRRYRRRSKQQKEAMAMRADTVHPKSDYSHWYASTQSATSDLPSYPFNPHAKQTRVEAPDVWQEPRELPGTSVMDQTPRQEMSK